MAAAIEIAPPRDWQNLSGAAFFVSGALAARYQAILDAINVDRLDVGTAHLWSATPFALEELLNLVGWGIAHEPARELIARHERELNQLKPRLAIFAPEVCARRIRAGEPLQLGVDSGRDWGLAAMGLDAVERVDTGSWELVWAQNAGGIAAGLGVLQARESRAAAALLSAVQSPSGNQLLGLVATLDVDRTVAAWGKLSPTLVDRRGITSHVAMVKEEPTAGREIARRLRDRFSSLGIPG